MKKIRDFICDMVFVISLTLLGKIELGVGNVMLPTYQIVVSIFWASGILKFMGNENEWKEELFDIMKDFFVSFTIIPLWYWMSGTYEKNLYEPCSILVHFGVILIMIYITYKSVKLSGRMAYYTHAVIPIIAVVLIRVGLTPLLAVVFAVILPELINYLLFIKNQKKE